PSPALEYPSLGSLAARVLPAPAGVPPYVTFSGNGVPGGAGYLGSSYSPFEVESGGGRDRVRGRGVALPAGFTVRDLDDRDRLRHRFDAAFKALDGADLPASLDKFH